MFTKVDFRERRWVSVFVALSIVVLSPSRLAAMPSATPTAIEAAVRAAEAAWDNPVEAHASKWLPLDEQIFTDLSPLEDSPQGVKLPEDQDSGD